MDKRELSDLWYSQAYEPLRVAVNTIHHTLRQIDSDLAFADWVLRWFSDVELSEKGEKAYRFFYDRKNALRHRKEEIVNYCKTMGITVPVTAVIPEELPSRRAKDDEVVEV